MSEITVKNLKYKYPGADRLALDGIDLSVEKGDFIGVIGANGAGKSTFAEALIGLVPQFFNGAYGGMVEIAGMKAETTPVSELCKKVGLVFQNPFNQLSGAKNKVFDEVAFGLENMGIAPDEMKERIERVLRKLDMWEYRDRNPFELSGGQMQRVAIASILVMDPDIIILDEPTSELDPEGTEEVFKTVETLSHSGKTIIMIEQKIEKIAKYCSHLLLLSEGKQIDYDTTAKVLSRPDLEDYGVKAPAFTRLCKALALTEPDGTYPVTLESAKKLISENKEHITAKAPTIAINDVAEDLSHVIYQVNDLDFYYRSGTDIFKNFNLLLDSRPTAIVGQNGAGKTTLAKLLKGLLKPCGGNIYFGQDDISKKTVAMLAGKVGYVFQNPDDQIFKYKILDEVMFGPLNIGMTEEAARKNAIDALAVVGLSDKKDENPYDCQLSERKMISIASVLAMNTDVLILDEPTIAQDTHGKEVISSIIKDLKGKGKLVISILHDMDFVAENFDRMIIMAHGHILEDNVPEMAFSNDTALKEARLQKPYTAELCNELALPYTYLTVEGAIACMSKK